ncbi:MAG: cytochrome c maturation protein CcmE [Armatimonadaceae bacterium]
MKPASWVGLIIILSALGYGMKAFVSNLTPYVPFAQARESKNQVQIMGKLDKSSVQSSVQELAFTLISPEDDRMPVSFTAARPPNFEQAIEVTAIGKYDASTGVFRAKNLLVKCPTKYQGTETKAYAAR